MSACQIIQLRKPQNFDDSANIVLGEGGQQAEYDSMRFRTLLGEFIAEYGIMGALRIIARGIEWELAETPVVRSDLLRRLFSKFARKF